MRPITDYIPKPLVPVRNVPVLEWQIRHLLRFGIREIVLCTGYKTGMIADRLRAKDFGAHVTISAEEVPLGTGGAIRQAARHIGGDNSFVVLNGDIITDIDIDRLVRARNAIATIPLRTNYGILDVDGDDDDSGSPRAITRFREKGSIPGMWMNAGIYHLGRETLNELPVVGDIEKTLFPKYAQAGRLGAVRFGERGGDKTIWQSIDSFKDLEACEEMLAKAGGNM